MPIIYQFVFTPDISAVAVPAESGICLSMLYVCKIFEGQSVKGFHYSIWLGSDPHNIPRVPN